jgi:hypothetical protein
MQLNAAECTACGAGNFLQKLRLPHHAQRHAMRHERLLECAVLLVVRFV